MRDRYLTISFWIRGILPTFICNDDDVDDDVRSIQSSAWNLGKLSLQLSEHSKAKRTGVEMACRRTLQIHTRAPVSTGGLESVQQKKVEIP